MRLIGWTLALGIAALFVWFAWINWEPVTVNLSATAYVEPALPVLVLAALLTGFLPTWLLFKLSGFLLRRKLAKAEKRIAALQGELSGPGNVAQEAAEAAILARSQAAGRAGGYEDLPPQATPMAVPLAN
jgi:uncharacterized integral membrane protein